MGVAQSLVDAGDDRRVAEIGLQHELLIVADEIALDRLARRVGDLRAAEGKPGRFLDGAGDRLVEKAPGASPFEEPVGIRIEVALPASQTLGRRPD